MTMVVQGQLQEVAGLLKVMTSTRRTSRGTRMSEFVHFLFLSHFLVLVAKGGEN
jgi:hypothetical protein